MKPTPVQQAVATRRCYSFDLQVDLPWRVERQRSMCDLERMHHRIWLRYKYSERAYREPPTLEVGRGHHGVSFCEGVSRIVLIPRQRSYQILLHEEVHAMGFLYHTPRFMKRYFELLRDYCGCDYDELVLQAAVLGIKIP